MSLDLWESRSLLVDLEAERRNQERLELLAKAVNEHSPEKLLEILRSMGTAVLHFMKIAVMRLFYCNVSAFGYCVPGAIANLGRRNLEVASEDQAIFSALFLLVERFAAHKYFEEWDKAIPIIIKIVASDLPVELRVEALSALQTILRSHLNRRRFSDKALSEVKKILEQLSPVARSKKLPPELKAQFEAGDEMIEDLITGHDFMSLVTNS